MTRGGVRGVLWDGEESHEELWTFRSHQTPGALGLVEVLWGPDAVDREDLGLPRSSSCTFYCGPPHRKSSELRSQ